MPGLDFFFIFWFFIRTIFFSFFRIGQPKKLKRLKTNKKKRRERKKEREKKGLDKNQLFCLFFDLICQAWLLYLLPHSPEAKNNLFFFVGLPSPLSLSLSLSLILIQSLTLSNAHRRRWQNLNGQTQTAELRLHGHGNPTDTVRLSRRLKTSFRLRSFAWFSQPHLKDSHSL